MMREIAVLVEDEQPAADRKDGQLLLGVFRGNPWTTRGGRIPGTLPPTITLYRIPILAVCRRPEDVPAKVLKVLGHEVGHAVGLGARRSASSAGTSPPTWRYPRMVTFTRAEVCRGREFVGANLRGARFVEADLSAVVMRGVEAAG